MKFSQEINQYVIGEKFAQDLKVPLSPTKYEDITRIDKILELTKGTSVIHVGCTDHLPLIDEKIKNNKYLHKLLVNNTKKCIGIDINKEAIDYLIQKHNFTDLFCLDILKDDIIIGENEELFDFVILGELIEHIDNPVDFLKMIRQKLQGKAQKILITTPNIFSLHLVKDIKKNVEQINSDHRYWFTPYTLTKIATIAGFINCEIHFASRNLPYIRRKIHGLKCRLGIKTYCKATHFSTLILVADF